MSAEAFLSPSWYRVAALRPALKSAARIRRHRFRGQVWYVVQDAASGRFNRFTPAAYQLLGMMDGQRTVDEVWNIATEQLGDDAPGQEQVIRLLSQLHAADLLQCAVSPDSTELFERFARHNRTRRKSNWLNPFAVRFPLWNPDRFLIRTLHWVYPFSRWWGMLLYLIVVALALALAGVHGAEFSQSISDRILAADNLLVLLLCFPIVKFLHELGHGYATRAGGGEVHEMGVLLLVFMPVPYVDASAASGFRSKWQRVLVGAAGMLTEVFIAAICFLVWVAAEPGLLRAVAFNIVLIAGVSTIVFNGNPLLRFDGYYILSDILEIPNLATRGNRYWRYLAERYLFRMPQTEPPLATPGERRWFLLYAPAALLYRVAVMVAIVLYIASQWFFVGVALAIWGSVTLLVWPLAKATGYLASLPRAAHARQHAVIASGALLALVAILVAAVPAPFRVQTEGVLWLPEEAHVRAGADGFVRAVLAQPGTEVAAGAPLIESRDAVVAAELRVSESRIAELHAQLDRQRFTERVQAEVTRQELMRELARHAHIAQRAAQLVATSRVAGELVIDRPEDLPGRYFHKGEILGYVIQDGRPSVRVVVSQDDIDLVRERLVRVDVRLAERGDAVYQASVVREVPAAREELPSSALSSEGGGMFAADPRDPKGERGLVRTFQFDLELPESVSAASYGGRVYVRFVLPPEPLARQWYRRIRQLFLAQFHV